MSTLTKAGEGYVAGLADAQAIANEVASALYSEGASQEAVEAASRVSTAILLERRSVEQSAR